MIVKQQMRMQEVQRQQLQQALSESEDEQSVIALRKDLEKFEMDAMAVRAAADNVKELLGGQRPDGTQGASDAVPEGVPPSRNLGQQQEE